MDDLLMVHEGDALQDLLHEAHARPLSQHELVLDHPVEELSAANAGKNIAEILFLGKMSRHSSSEDDQVSKITSQLCRLNLRLQVQSYGGEEMATLLLCCAVPSFLEREIALRSAYRIRRIQFSREVQNYNKRNN